MGLGVGKAIRSGDVKLPMTVTSLPRQFDSTREYLPVCI